MHFLKSHRSTLLTLFSVLAAAFAAPYLVPGDPDAQVFRNGVLPALLLLAALWGGSSSAAPAGRGPAEGTLAVHRPLETRQTHSPSPVRVRGAESCTSSSAAGAAMVFQSNSNI